MVIVMAVYAHFLKKNVFQLECFITYFMLWHTKASVTTLDKMLWPLVTFHVKYHFTNISIYEGFIFYYSDIAKSTERSQAHCQFIYLFNLFSQLLVGPALCIKLLW